MPRTVLVGYDASAEAQDALTLATALADRDAELVLCCVHPARPVAAAVVAGEHDVPGRAEAQRRLDDGVARAAGRARVPTIAVAATSAASGLYAVAEAEDADVLVVGSSHRGTLGRVVLGSTTSQVLTAPPCAVAVAPAGLRDRGDAVEIRTITVAFDGGGEARRAAALAADVARAHRAQLRLLTVLEPPTEALGWAGSQVWPEYRDDAREIAERDLAAAVTALGDGVEVQTEIVEGVAVQELLLASARSDLLVLGSRGYGPMRRVLLGAVAARVAGAAACPVLVAPRGDEAD